MMIVMKEGATDEQIAHVVERVEEVGCAAHISRGELLTVIGAIGDRDRVAALGLEGTPGVDHLVPILKPYKLASAQFKKGGRTVVEVDGRRIGGDHFGLIAGPCTVESREQTLEVARAVNDAGATMLRGGAYKPRTSPYSFQGLGEKALLLLREVADSFGLAAVTEVVTPDDVPVVAEHADMLQVGARNMGNFALLRAVGAASRPVLLKRGLGSTLDELLQAAEYILASGNEHVALCERGIRTFEPSTRFTLDINAVPVLKSLTSLPVVVDPSHATGHSAWVQPVALAGVAAGADGLLIEVHPRPTEALSDGPQSLTPAAFAELMSTVRRVAAAVGRAA